MAPAFENIPYYSRDVEFRDLAKKDANFAAALKAASGKGFINFQSEDFVLYVDLFSHHGISQR